MRWQSAGGEGQLSNATASYESQTVAWLKIMSQSRSWYTGEPTLVRVSSREFFFRDAAMQP